MSKILSFLRNKRVLEISATVIISVFLVAVFVYAATTIGSYISTEGTLTVADLTTLGNATTTLFSVTDNTWLGDADADTLTVRAGVWSLTSTATTTVAMTNGLNFDSDSNTFVIDPNANKVGIGTSTANIAGLIFGTCSVNPQSINAATSSVVSTSCSATGVQSGDKVFVTPPSDLISSDNWLVFEGASASTTANYIEITLFNASTTAAIDSPSRTWSWMGIR